MKNIIHTKSRRNTPWTGEVVTTPLQAYIDLCTEKDYVHRHPSILASGESKLLNSYEVTNCKFCRSTSIIKEGFSSTGIRRYRCKKCGRRFTILTNTIFDSRKIPISEWMCFLLDIFGFSSFNITSKVNRNSINTTKYWVKKLFLLLENIQDAIILEDTIWLDETFYKVRSSDIKRKEDGKEYRGQSLNQICIGIACDNTKTVIFVEGLGKTSQRKTLDAFGSHIKEGSTLIHDKEKSHNVLVNALNLRSIAYDSRELKGLADKDNPLDKVNRKCALLKGFLNAHSGFNREDLQGYLNLFSIMVNPPENKYEKIEKILSLSLNKPILLRYRDKNPI